MEFVNTWKQNINLVIWRWAYQAFFYQLHFYYSHLLLTACRHITGSWINLQCHCKKYLYELKWFSDIRKWFSDIRNFLISENQHDFLISENHILISEINFWYQKMIFWYQKISTIFFISEIHVFSDIRNSIFRYQKLFLYIRNYFLISEIPIFWYQKIISDNQKTEFLISENHFLI